MTQRISLAKSNAGLDAMRAVESWLDKNLDPKLLALVKVRASQINGCAFCLHMHSEQALKLGENSARLLSSMRGVSPRSTPSESAPRWPGQTH